MTFNTGNPIGSTDARDLSDNAKNFDTALGTTASTWTDRLGVTRDSFEGRLEKGSFYRVGTFAAGYTLTNMRQTLEYSGHEYSWAGTFPKVVAAGATPATSGGIAAGAWVDRTDVALRNELYVTRSNFVNIKSYDYLNNPTSAFYSALGDSGYIDLMGVDITVNVTSQMPINKDVYIKNGTIRFLAPLLTRVFLLQSCNIFRFENCNIYGNSNGSINDSFDATSGTYSLAQAAPSSDGAVKNVQLEGCYVYGMIILDDTKYRQGDTGRYFVDGGYATKCTFEHVPGHAFSFNLWKSFKIYKNKFKNIGALCADFSTATMNCELVDNEIDGASGVAKTQNQYSYNVGNIPIDNKINRNKAINITGGISGNVAAIKVSGYKTEIKGNDITTVGTTAADNVELYGTVDFSDNTINVTTNILRSMITTITDPNLVSVYGPQVFDINDNILSGGLYLYRGQNTSASKVRVNGNYGRRFQRLFFGEASLNSPDMELNFNDIDTSSFVINPVQMSNSITSMGGLEMIGNKISAQGLLYLVGANGGRLSANRVINSASGATSCLALISTTSISVIGNSGNYTFGATSGNVIVEHNSIY